jgi:superfamily II DNA/RNA helicase
MSVEYLFSNLTDFQVLDEADRLLTPTFTAELSYLFNVIPKERQTCLFTATWTPSIEQLADASPRPGKQKPFVHRMSEMYVYSLIYSASRLIIKLGSRQYRH